MQLERRIKSGSANVSKELKAISKKFEESVNLKLDSAEQNIHDQYEAELNELREQLNDIKFQISKQKNEIEDEKQKQKEREDREREKQKQKQKDNNNANNNENNGKKEEEEEEEELANIPAEIKRAKYLLQKNPWEERLGLKLKKRPQWIVHMDDAHKAVPYLRISPDIVPAVPKLTPAPMPKVISDESERVVNKLKEAGMFYILYSFEFN